MKHWKQLHRILGTILAPLFVLWLISGSVMIFSSYPRLGDAADRVADTIPELLPPLDSVRSRLPEGDVRQTLHRMGAEVEHLIEEDVGIGL